MEDPKTQWQVTKDTIFCEQGIEKVAPKYDTYFTVYTACLSYENQ